MCTALTNGLARFIDSMSLPRSPVVVGYSTGSADGARPDETRAITSALLRCQ